MRSNKNLLQKTLLGQISSLKEELAKTSCERDEAVETLASFERASILSRTTHRRRRARKDHLLFRRPLEHPWYHHQPSSAASANQSQNLHLSSSLRVITSRSARYFFFNIFTIETSTGKRERERERPCKIQDALKKTKSSSNAARHGRRARNLRSNMTSSQRALRKSRPQTGRIGGKGCRGDYISEWQHLSGEGETEKLMVSERTLGMMARAIRVSSARESWTGEVARRMPIARKSIRVTGRGHVSWHRRATAAE